MAMNNNNHIKISIIGGGAMGSALTLGLLRSNDCDPRLLAVSNPHFNKLKELEKTGIKISESNIEVIKDADLVFIAVKPWKVKEVLDEILPEIKDKDIEICFIVAGISTKELKDLINSSRLQFSIAMPNTAMRLGKSMTFLVTDGAKCSKTLETLEKVGKVQIIEERLLPAATSLASCGIAYAMRYVRAATEGGVELGFKATEAQNIVTQTLEGAIALLDTPGSHPEIEIDKVTTPGGLTIKGLNAMEKAGFSSAVIQGLKASCL